jgi:hypothetical protein
MQRFVCNPTAEKPILPAPSFFIAGISIMMEHWLSWKSRANTRPLHQTIDEIRSKDPEAIKGVADTWLICALAERDAAAAEAALVALGDNIFGNDAVQLRRGFGEGLIGRMTKDEAKARAAFTQE